MNQPSVSYKHHRFSPEVIARAVWPDIRLPLSLRPVKEMLLERGVVSPTRRSVVGERNLARTLRSVCGASRRPRNDIWHFDEVVISIGGHKHWLWRAVDQDGYVLDEIVQARRDTKATKWILKRLLKKQGIAPKRMITDKLRS